MAWLAFDRAIKNCEEFGLQGPVDRWRALRDEIHADVCKRGYDKRAGSFVQFYGSKEPDASLLIMAMVGFLPASDPRIKGTVRAIERRLMQRGFLLRYRTEHVEDGLPPGEGVFLACAFWLAENYIILGQTAKAKKLFKKLLALRNDVGLLAEEYDPRAKRMLGNFPQAYSHTALVNTAFRLQDRD
jgi:GH15 family glucan-1,4-alpha-glucosidase